MSFTYNDIFPDDKDLTDIRQKLYSSEGQGYYIVKGFLTPEFSQHMRRFWDVEVMPQKNFTELIPGFDKKQIFYLGCPNYYYPTQHGHAFYNFFWNHPIDQVTHAVSFQIQYLRNLLEAKNIYHDFFPATGNSYSYRVVNSKNGKEIVEPHKDWAKAPHFDPARLQATLILSKKGVDYTGTGMTLKNNDGSKTQVFDADIEVEVGDLVYWRYNNEHSVIDVQTKEDQLGFMRMIFPPEFISKQKPAADLDTVGTKQLYKTLQKRVLRKLKLSK